MSRAEQRQAAVQSASGEGSIASQVIGVWSLLPYTELQQGQVNRYPLGFHPEGFLIYTPDGLVSAQLMKPGRPLFQSRD